MTAYPAPAKDALQLYPHGNSGRQRVNPFQKLYRSMLCSNLDANPTSMEAEVSGTVVAKSAICFVTVVLFLV